jgi:hypothetical protein
MDDIHHLFIPRSARSLRVGLQGIDNLKRGIKPDVGIVRVAIEVGTVSAMLGLSKHTPENSGFIVSHRSLLGEM